jgi:hypothetical protein
MKFGVLRFNLQGCSFVTLQSLPPVVVISSCSRNERDFPIALLKLL